MFFDRRRPWRSFFSDFDRFDRMMDELFEEAFKDIERMRKKGVEGEFKQYGPYVYGFSLSVGPDGKPVIKEFGNVKPDKMGKPSIQEVRDPLVDVFDEKDTIKILAEIPGVKKEDIDIRVRGRTLTIKTEKERKFFKELELPCDVKMEGMKAKYNNGVLEIVLKKEKEKRGGTKIKVE